ncbi:anti-sigma F factor [Thermincola ferriacetica]
MKLKNKMSIEILSLPENVALARVTVAAFAAQLDFTLEDLEEIKVAVSEAVSNSLIHGYANKTDCMVGINAVIYDNDVLEVEIKDNGVGIADIQQAMQPAYSTTPERMGLGFSFMQSFMDSVQVDSAPGQGTTVKLTKKPSKTVDKQDN